MTHTTLLSIVLLIVGVAIAIVSIASVLSEGRRNQRRISSRFVH